MPTATFRFYAELNAFLAPPLRGRSFAHEVAATATLKHTVEALGVPHTEVDLLLVNGEPAGFERRVSEGDRVAVYPAFRTLDVAALSLVGEPPRLPSDVPPRFIADAHLGALARLLRMSGFDTLYDNRMADAAIERIALHESRIVLTRDRELLKRRDVARGAFVHAIEPEAQWREVVARLGLARLARPLTLCLECNAPLCPVPDKAAVAERLPPSVRARHAHFSTCDRCARLYWEGSHWQRMRARLDALLRPAAQEKT